MTDTSRESLIKDLRMIGPLSHGHFAYVGNRAANMLEADEQELTNLQAECDTIAEINHAHFLAQQVAVPTLKIKPFTQRLRDNREADYSLDALMPPTRREIASAMYEEVVELRDALKAQQVAVPVPLTDGEIDAVTISQWGEMHGQPLAAHRAFARAIEARLGITQQGDAPCNA